MAWKESPVFTRKWRPMKPIWFIIPLELLCTVGLLVLSALAQPDLYRSELWYIGYQYRWNSNPTVILYSYANNAPYPNVPFVWTTRLTNFMVACSVISLFIWLGKLIGFIMTWWIPIVGVVFHSVMVTLYAVSVYGQMGPDYLDPRYPSPIAWYIRKGCGPAQAFGSTDYMHCQMAVGTFAASVLILAIYVALLSIALYSIYSAWKMKKQQTRDVEHDMDDGNSSQGSPHYDKVYEMMPPSRNAPASVPFTPRTQAFHTLDRRLPLREQYG